MNMKSPVTCKLCSVSCEDVELYFDHYLSKHVEVPCPYCNFSSKTLGALQVHIHRKHGDERQGEAKKCQLPPWSPPSSTVVVNSDNQSEFPSTSRASTDSATPSEVALSSIPPSKLLSYSAVDPCPPRAVKLAVLKFYVMLEGLKIVPSATVQVISENIARMTEMSHHCLKKSLEKEMAKIGLDKCQIDMIISKAFITDPFFNVHHKQFDVDLVTSIHLRKKFMMSELVFVPSIEIFLGLDKIGKRKSAHYVPIKQSLEAALKDPTVKAEIKKSFISSTRPSDLEDFILEDFTDGEVFQSHRSTHSKCIQLVFSQDAFEFSPLGPAQGLYKSIGAYFYIGNLPPEYRSKVKMIFLAQLIQERFLKPNEEEVLNCVNKFEEALECLIKDLNELKVAGLVIDGELIPVCFLFCLGDNLGSHQIGAFVQSFTAEFFCRYCPISATEFKARPHITKTARTPQDYDECVIQAKEKFDVLKRRMLEVHSRKKIRQEEQGLPVSTTLVSKSGLKKLQAINHKGVKPYQSALNSILDFHVSQPGLPPCLAHDLFSGVVDLDLAKILENLIEVKEWFTLETLNRRITSFKYRGTDAADAPCAIRSFDKIKGHACETWTLLRLLPMIICDLIKDEEDEMWKLLLQLKELCEYICAPKIRKKQVAYLQTLIELYLCDMKRLLPACLTPKHHFLAHYAWLILMFGPLLRLFTLRFESKHVFFKNVGKTCRCFKNITLTLAQKYQYRFAYDNVEGLLLKDLEYNDLETLDLTTLPEDVHEALKDLQDIKTVRNAVYKGILYKNNEWMVLERVEPNDLCLGRIEKILIFPGDVVHFILRYHNAVNTYQGFYQIEEKAYKFAIQCVDDLPDSYPLPSYYVNGHLSLSLKHSTTFM